MCEKLTFLSLCSCQSHILLLFFLLSPSFLCVRVQCSIHRPTQVQGYLMEASIHFLTLLFYYFNVMHKIHTGNKIHETRKVRPIPLYWQRWKMGRVGMAPAHFATRLFRVEYQCNVTSLGPPETSRKRKTLSGCWNIGHSLALKPCCCDQ